MGYRSVGQATCHPVQCRERAVCRGRTERAMRASGIAGAAVLSMLAASCSAADPPAVEPGARPASTPASSPESGSATVRTPARLEVPLAIVMHPTRSPLDIDAALARDLLAGRIASWSELG